LALVLAVAGCGGPAPAETPPPLDPSAGPAAPTTRATPRPGVFQLGNAPAYVALAVKDVTVRTRPTRKGDVVAVFPSSCHGGARRRS
ncbi:MAG: hypothetical protein ABW222_17045, partial [Actinomycetota bacterium]